MLSGIICPFGLDLYLHITCILLSYRQYHHNECYPFFITMERVLPYTLLYTFQYCLSSLNYNKHDHIISFTKMKNKFLCKKCVFPFCSRLRVAAWRWDHSLQIILKGKQNWRKTFGWVNSQSYGKCQGKRYPEGHSLEKSIEDIYRLNCEEPGKSERLTLSRT